MALFILSADLSHTFIAGGKKDDGGEREQKGDGTRNAPLTENNAEIVSGPREEHLSSQSRTICARIADRFTFIEHWFPPMSMPL
jgi:hypothetical protein